MPLGLVPVRISPACVKCFLEVVFKKETLLENSGTSWFCNSLTSCACVSFRMDAGTLLTLDESVRGITVERLAIFSLTLHWTSLLFEQYKVRGSSRITIRPRTLQILPKSGKMGGRTGSSDAVDTLNASNVFKCGTEKGLGQEWNWLQSSDISSTVLFHALY